MITRIARKVNHKSAELPAQKICVDVYYIKKQLPVENIREGLFYQQNMVFWRMTSLTLEPN
ncbi:MAG TPA: hypothetical protein HPP66_10305 [Planctomycetes bacterium]|nr:hypothetical protein [Planctomycetota bacterium]